MTKIKRWPNERGRDFMVGKHKLFQADGHAAVLECPATMSARDWESAGPRTAARLAGRLGLEVVAHGL